MESETSKEVARPELEWDAAALQKRISLDEVKIDPAWALRIPANLAIRRNVLPLSRVGRKVYIACLEPDDATFEAIERYIRHDIQPILAEPDSLKQTIKKVYTGFDGQPAALVLPQLDTKSSKELDPDEVADVCDEFLHAAVIRHASDIHIEPTEEDVVIRFRVDGVIESYCRLPKGVQQALLSRLKVLSGMDIAERRLPQDGRFRIPDNATGLELDLRVACIPTSTGERMTIRLLASKTDELTLEKLGMQPAHLAAFESAIAKPHGLILLTGPTGSGKSTTLYAALRRLLAIKKINVLTIEDPIEYNLQGVSQIEVDANDRVTFDKALRSVLRHDPDVLMIGEIRDELTASVAIKAALTGHLVFSTLHTNSAVSAVTRLIDMGVEPYLIGATLRLSIAQRLVRKLCPHCQHPHHLDPEQAELLRHPELTKETVYQSRGCFFCAGRGLAGRVGLFEFFETDEQISRMIAQGAGEGELLAARNQIEMPRLVDDAVNKMMSGKTNFEEVMRVLMI